MCDGCSGSRAVPDVFGDYTACPLCVIASDDGETWVVMTSDEESSEP